MSGRSVTAERGNGARSRPAREGGPTLLVVEDDAAIGELVARTLRHHGFRVLSCSTGRQAIDALWSAGFSIDLVLADVVLPDVRGVELQGLARGACPGVRVCFMSGHSLGELQDEGLVADEETFLPKPFRASDLLAFVRRALLAAA